MIGTGISSSILIMLSWKLWIEGDFDPSGVGPLEFNESGHFLFRLNVVWFNHLSNGLSQAFTVSFSMIFILLDWGESESLILGDRVERNKRGK